MALVYSPTPKLGSICPEFNLPTVEYLTLPKDVAQEKNIAGAETKYKNQKLFGHISTDDLRSYEASVVMFICGHCPYVLAIEDRIIQLASELLTKNALCVAICSNDSMDYPEDSPKKLFERWTEKKYQLPYLIDESQEVAKSFGAVCTPDFFVYNKNLELTYRGRLDDSWKDQDKVINKELANAVDNILAGTAISEASIPAMGCSIKWRDS